MHAYIPGEQPKDPKLVKLNTNENNYGPSPRVVEALHALAGQRAARYPDPLCVALREAIARDLRVDARQVIMGNGSDEVLKMAAEAWAGPGDRIGYLWPTYSLYPIFVHKAGATEVRLPWTLKGPTQEEALAAAPRDLKVAYVTNPNPPFGLTTPIAAIARFAEERPETLVVVDEAYIAYGGESAIGLVREGRPNVVVTRTFSKSHSLAGMRVGFAVSHADAADVLFKVKDSYNLNVAAQVAALESWNDAAWTDNAVRRIVADRERVSAHLRKLGFDVVPSAGNFLFARRADATAFFKGLRERHILVRWFDTPELRDGIRVSIGTTEEMDAFLAAMDEIAAKR